MIGPHVVLWPHSGTAFQAAHGLAANAMTDGPQAGLDVAHVMGLAAEINQDGVARVACHTTRFLHLAGFAFSVLSEYFEYICINCIVLQ